MRIPVSWLRELVRIPDAPEGPATIGALADALTMRGFEVGAIEPWPDPDSDDDPATADDAILDLEITTNRPDCLSVLGIAREVGTIYGTELIDPALADDPDPGAEPALQISVLPEDTELCPRYVGAVADVEVGMSPRWLTTRLEAAEVRPINNVVDITNYVMLELGQPMHAFDLSKLAGPEIRVRRARDGETIRTLDDVERPLTTEMLTIADAERPVAIAGVMGGADSEVGAGTRTILLEAAHFNPISVRRTSKRLPLSTDASYRFERGADPEAPVRAIRRAWQLLQDLGAGKPRGPIIDCHPSPGSRLVVPLRHARIGRVLGQTVEETFVAPTLARLGFGASAEDGDDQGTRWQVTVPTFRVDVSREEDLIEEVARHHGYDRLPTTFPALTAPAAPPAPWLRRDRLVRRLLTGCGFTEAITYGFIERDAALAVQPDADDIVALANPLSELGAVLRPSLIPGLVDSLIHNRRREQQDIQLFEVGSRFRQSNGETPALGLVVTGAAAPVHWSDPPRSGDLFDLSGVIARVAAGFGGSVAFEPDEAPAMVPGRTATVTLEVDGEQRPFGVMGQLDPALATSRGLPGQGAVYVAELDLRCLDTGVYDRLQAAPVPRYPSITRDLSLEVDDALPAADVRDTIRAAAGPHLVEVQEVDRYQGKGVASGAVSLSVRLTFRASDRTLTDPEVQAATDDVVKALAAAHQATLR